jgi:hypothetical protein
VKVISTFPGPGTTKSVALYCVRRKKIYQEKKKILPGIIGKKNIEPEDT